MGNFFKFMVSTLVIAGAATISASAQDAFPQDGSPIESGKLYTITQFQNYNATFTPSVSGKLLQEGCPELKVIDAGESSFTGYGPLGQNSEWTVEEGVTYTISNPGFIIGNAEVRFQMEAEQGVVLNSSLPAAGETLAANSNGTGYILLQFNTTITYDHAYLIAGDAKSEVYTQQMSSTNVDFSVRDAMKAMYESGALDNNGGTPITLSISGLRSQSGILYNGDGNFSISFVAAPKLLELMSYTVPETFKSYYAPGNPEGIFQFVFDRELANDGNIRLDINCGNPESEGTYYSESIPVTVEGNVATADLTGKLRLLDNYLTYQGSEYVGLKLSNVKDPQGNYAEGYGEGNIGSYPFNFPYQLIQASNVVSEFTPATGGSLQGVDKMEIWFNNASALSFDGVQFTYNNNGTTETVVVLNDQLDIQRDGNEVTITVNVPAAVQGMNKINVSLYNVSSVDGYDHNVIAEYDQFVVNLLSPIKPGEAAASSGDDDFVFTINNTDLYHYIRYDFYNAEVDGWAYGTQLNKQDNGTWTAYNGNYPMFSDFQPYMVVSAYYNENDYRNDVKAAETYTFKFIGTTTPFAFSDIHFESISPDPDQMIVPEEGFYWTATFDGLVKLDPSRTGMPLDAFAGMTPFEKLEPVYDGEPTEEGYSNIWRLYPSYSILESEVQIPVVISARDQNDLLIEGNSGSKEYSELRFYFNVENNSNYTDFTVTPASDSTLTEISSFTLSYEGKPVGINFTYTGTDKPMLLSRDQSVAYTFSEKDIQIEAEIIGEDELGYPIYSEESVVVLSVNPTITEDGTYMLYIPAGYFTIGSQFETTLSSEYTGTYYIGEEEPVEGHELVLNPAPGIVSALDRIDFVGDDMANAMISYDAVLEITDANGQVVYSVSGTEIDANSFDWNTWEFIGFYITPGITEDGVYTLSLPADLFEFEDMSTSAAMTAVYEVKSSGVSAVVVETSDVYEVYTISGVKVMTTTDASALSTLSKGIYVINGKKVLVK